MNEAKVYAVGDIHGCCKTLINLLDKIGYKRGDTLFLMGDYIDRGPRIKETLDFIINLIDEGNKVYPIMGNHELMLLKSAESTENLNQWIQNAGATTLKSLGVDTPMQIPQKYMNFFESLKYYYYYKNFILVHGGMNFSIDNPFLDLEAMVWERNSYVDMDKTRGKRLICGHTPVSVETITESLSSNRILLDGGCVYYKKYPKVGNLCALDLDTFDLFVHKNIEE
jgi:serine/threonine protein phosphatase 1